MSQVKSVFVDYNLVWAHVVADGRHTYESVEMSELEDTMRKDGLSEEAAAAKILDRYGFDLSKLPHIEDATKAMQYLWASVMESESCMSFVGDSNENDCCQPWDELGMTKKEFEAQVDADVQKYGLQGVVCKEDEDALYACYGGLMSAFSGKIAVYREYN